jgi:hypothetical protein
MTIFSSSLSVRVPVEPLAVLRQNEQTGRSCCLVPCLTGAAASLFRLRRSNANNRSVWYPAVATVIYGLFNSFGDGRWLRDRLGSDLLASRSSEGSWSHQINSSKGSFTR